MEEDQRTRVVGVDSNGVEDAAVENGRKAHQVLGDRICPQQEASLWRCAWKY